MELTNYLNQLCNLERVEGGKSKVFSKRGALLYEGVDIYGSALLNSLAKEEVRDVEEYHGGLIGRHGSTWYAYYGDVYDTFKRGTVVDRRSLSYYPSNVEEFLWYVSVKYRYLAKGEITATLRPSIKSMKRVQKFYLHYASRRTNRTERTSCFLPAYYGKGSWYARTYKDAWVMAKDFIDVLSRKEKERFI